MRVLWLNPAGSPGEPFYRYVRANARPGTEVVVKDFEKGPRHLEYLYYEALVIPDVIHSVKRGEAEGFDGAVIGCFADPGLLEAREVTRGIPVAGPMESSLALAATLGYRFSVIIGRRKWQPLMNDLIHRYGFAPRLASFREVGLGVRDFERAPDVTAERLEEASRKAVHEDGAEVVVLGCTGTYGHYRELQRALKVPVIDPVVAAMNHIEMLVDLRDRFGWAHSRVGAYESPPEDELASWDLGEAYGIDDYPGLWGWTDRRSPREHGGGE